MYCSQLRCFALKPCRLHESVLRGAFDVGSGACKVLIGRVSADNKLTKVLFEEQADVLMQQDLSQRADGLLSETIMAQGLEALRKFQHESVRLQVPRDSLRGVATEVFRKAKNGNAFLARVKQELGIDLRLVSQAQEGVLGFRTALAVSSLPAASVVSWDSGGASFQLTASEPEAKQITEENVHVYQGKFGASVATCLMVEEVQKKSFVETQSPNPCSLEDVNELVALIGKGLPPNPRWLQEVLSKSDCQVVAHAGPTGAFKLAADCIGKASFTAEDVWQAIGNKLGKGDNDPDIACHLQGAMIVPKLTLVYTVMTQLQIKEAHYYPSTSGCAPGVIISPEIFD